MVSNIKKITDVIILIFLIGCNYRIEKVNKSYSKNIDQKNTNSKMADSSSEGKFNQIFGYQIIQKKCMSCHNQSRAQGGASFSTLDEVKRWKSRIVFRSLEKKDMPPDQSLTKGERQELDQWIQNGMEEKFTGGEQLDEVPGFEVIKKHVFENHCFQCHAGLESEAQLDLENLELIRLNINKIWERTLVRQEMPMSPILPLSAWQKKLLSHWLIEGAPE